MKKIVLAIILCVSIVSMCSCKKEDKPVTVLHNEDTVTENNLRTIDVFDGVEIHGYYDDHEEYVTDENSQEVLTDNIYPWLQLSIVSNNATVKEICEKDSSIDINSLYYETESTISADEIVVRVKFAADKVNDIFNSKNIQIQSEYKDFVISRKDYFSELISEDMYTDEVKKISDEIALKVIDENNYTLEKKYLSIWNKESDNLTNDKTSALFLSHDCESILPKEKIKESNYGVAYVVEAPDGYRYQVLVKFLFKGEKIISSDYVIRGITENQFEQSDKSGLGSFGIEYIEVE